ncbi:MAG: 6-phosphogluconolactonase [Candidatus Promineifilaceae bacterium]
MSGETHLPDLRVVQDSAALAAAAAKLFATAAARAVAVRNRFLVTLSGGSTPQDLFSLLARPPFATAIPWPAVHVYWGDERLVPPDDPGSNYYHARRLLLDKVPITADQVHRMKGELAAAEATADYAHCLARAAGPGRIWPRFDLALMGLGADGHTASLFPGSPAVTEQEVPVVSVTASYEGRPAERLTLTPPVFNDAREILFLVSGSAKAKALAAVLDGQDGPQTWPAQAIRPRTGEVIWLVDESAARLLTGF